MNGRKSLRVEMRAAVQDAVTFQRTLHVKEKKWDSVAMRKEGGGVVEAPRPSNIRSSSTP